MEAILQSLTEGLSAFFAFLPQLVGAVVILIVGYVIAKVLQAVVGRVLKGIGFDGWMERVGSRGSSTEPRPTRHPRTSWASWYSGSSSSS